MPLPIKTAAEAKEYLAKNLRWEDPETEIVEEFTEGWVIQRVPADREYPTGLPIMILTAETGVIYLFPSWSPNMAIERYRAAIRNGEQPGPQIFPFQTRLHLTLTRDEGDRVWYRMQLESLTLPGATEPDSDLVIYPRNFAYSPTSNPHSMAAAHIRSWFQTHGTWPQQLTAEY